MKIGILVVIGLALGVSGCAARTHLTESHGRAYRQALAQQAVNPRAGEKAPVNRGLDSQEAAVIAQNYRGSLAPEGGPTQKEQILIVSPSAQKAGNKRGDYMPPASVPTER